MAGHNARAFKLARPKIALPRPPIRPSPQSRQQYLEAISCDTAGPQTPGSTPPPDEQRRRMRVWRDGYGLTDRRCLLGEVNYQVSQTGSRAYDSQIKPICASPPPSAERADGA